MESGSDSGTQRDQLPPTPRSRRSQTSAHPRPSLPREEAELLQETEGRKAGLAGWRSLGLRSAGEATTLIGRFLKSMARACQSRARALYFASQESKGSRDRAQTGGRKTRQGAPVHVPVCAWMRVCAPVRVETWVGMCTGERVPLVTLREKMSVPSMSYVKETIKTELNCQASGMTSTALFQIKVIQGRTLSEWASLRNLGGERGKDTRALRMVPSGICVQPVSKTIAGRGWALKSIVSSSSLFFSVHF